MHILDKIKRFVINVRKFYIGFVNDQIFSTVYFIMNEIASKYSVRFIPLLSRNHWHVFCIETTAFTFEEYRMISYKVTSFLHIYISLFSERKLTQRCLHSFHFHKIWRLSLWFCFNFNWAQIFFSIRKETIISVVASRFFADGNSRQSRYPL